MTSQRPTVKYPAVESMAPARQEEINESTPENPVHLTWEEIDAMNPMHVQHGIGAGRFTMDPKPGSPTERMQQMKTAGYSEAEIGDAMGLSESTVKRLLRSMRA